MYGQNIVLPNLKARWCGFIGNNI